MGASLGLLAFMLAFSFAVAQKHFEERTNAYLLEVTAIDAAYRGASLLDQKSGSEARGLLRQFVQLRRDTSNAEDRDELEEVVMLIRDAERLHDMLWQVADRSMQSPGDSIDDSIFSSAIMEMIRANDERVQHTMFNRISPIIWLYAAVDVCSVNDHHGLPGWSDRQTKLPGDLDTGHYLCRCVDPGHGPGQAADEVVQDESEPDGGATEPDQL